jgi:hypothetical protein
MAAATLLLSKDTSHAIRTLADIPNWFVGGAEVMADVKKAPAKHATSAANFKQTFLSMTASPITTLVTLVRVSYDN